MFSFLKQFLVAKNILIALEEGGTCLDIFFELKRLSLKKTILLEAIESLPSQNIFHEFVDITQEEVIQLIEQRQIQACADLRDCPKAKLRDPYIAGHAIDIFSQHPQDNGLLLCARAHFFGVTQYLQAYSQARGFSLTPVSLLACPWYKTEEQIDKQIDNEEGHTCRTESGPSKERDRI